MSQMENNDDAPGEGTFDISTIAKQKQNQASSRTGPIDIGENVEVTGGDRLYAGVVTDIVSETEYKIRYFEFDTIVSLPPTSLVRISVSDDHYDPYEIEIGMQCQCKYATDAQYYDCVVSAETKYGYQVQYTQYGNVEEVPIEYLRPTPELESSTTAPASAFSSAASSKKEKKTEDGLIVIPESLKILPTDTEEEKNRKRKKIKVIKNKNRIVTLENEVKETQQTWQKFVAKGAKRSLAGLNKSSMFTTSELSTEGKLGVQNSGKGMTSFENRKKHKFDLSEV